MSILLDLLIVALIGFFAWRGYKSSLIRGLCGVLALIIALYCANLFASIYSDEFTGVLKPFMNGIVDSSYDKVMGGVVEEGQEDVKILTDKEKEDVYTVSVETIRRMGLPDNVAEKIASDVASEDKRVSQEMANNVAIKICEKTIFTITFVLAFALIAIIFAVIGNLINLTFSLPELKKVDIVGGIALGIVRGIIIILVIACLGRYLGYIIGKEVINKTILFDWLINSNLIANLLGI